jgi:hypothetical protein
MSDEEMKNLASVMANAFIDTLIARVSKQRNVVDVRLYAFDLGLTRTWADKAIKSRSFKSFKVGHQYFARRSDIDDFLFNQLKS